MKTFKTIFFVVSLFMISGCYGPLTGTVIDAETKKPIEGAVICVQWVVTKGIPGFSHGEKYKFVEAETDKDGKFKIEGAYSLNPTLEPLAFVIYKPGYSAWQLGFTYRFPEPDIKRRGNFHWWGINHDIELEKFKQTYSHSLHI